MELLSRVVPAVRETRVALVTGLLWLLSLWLFVSSHWAVGDFLQGTDEPPGLAWQLGTALGILGSLGLGLAVTATAYLLGSLANFIWELVLRPLDERAIRGHAARSFAEAQLRLQLVPPICVLLGQVALLRSVLFAWAAPVLLAGHGMVLWRQALRAPMKSDLREADLSSAHLAGANFSHSDLSGANLQSANLRKATLDSTNISEAQFNGARIDEVELWAVGNGLTDAQLRQVASGRGVDLRAADLRGANLRDVQLPKADLSGANLQEAQMQGANLRSAKLTTDSTRGLRANLSRARLMTTDLKEADLAGANLSEADLTDASLPRSILRGANLTRADLSGVNLRHADLREADLSEANLSGAQLNGSLLDGANLEDAVCYRGRLPVNLPRGHPMPRIVPGPEGNVSHAPLREFREALQSKG